MSSVLVWMPIYNEEKHLRKAIESVLSQSHTDLSLFISDNHSTDTSLELAVSFAKTDRRISVTQPKEHLAGIPHMQWLWNEISYREQDYTIHIGGHDVWNQPNFLEMLVTRFEGNVEDQRRDGREIAIVYPDTWQIDADDNLVGHYKDFIQLCQVKPVMIPQLMVTAVNSPHLFGLWNEKIRRQTKFRHACSGWDHLIVCEAAVRGSILYEGAAQLVMRSPKPGDCNLTRYGERHLSKEQLAAGPRDFKQQLDWMVHILDLSLQNVPEGEARAFYRAILTTSMFATYISLRGLNLHIIEGAMDEFNNNTPAVRSCYGAMGHINAAVREMLASSDTEGKS